jgi:flagellum-specific peptidoglycan hydrolase FlgJ
MSNICGAQLSIQQIKAKKIKHAEIVYAQYRLETGNGVSKAFREYNNAFGFTLKGKLMRFKSVNECVEYYKAWQAKRYVKGDYYVFLQKIGYAEDNKYIELLKQF